MFGGDEIIFSGSYKGFKLGIKYDLAGKKPEEVADALAGISAKIEPYAYEFSGIDTKAIEKFAEVKGKGISAVADFLEKNSSEWNRKLKEVLKDPKLKSAADSYLFNRLLTKAGVEFKVSSNSSIKAEKEEMDDQISFIGRYDKWMAIKKLSLEKVKDYEVSGILAGINFTVVNKSFDFAGTQKDDDTVKALIKGKRKSLSNAVDVLKELESKNANAYLVCKTLEEAGYRPYASSHMLTDAYPDIKPPKVKGRKPKG